MSGKSSGKTTGFFSCLFESVMKTRHFLTVILVLCTGFLLFALYLQIFWKMLPCPLCVLQRYAFAVIGICCAVGLATGKIRISAITAFLSSLAGMGFAIYQLWVIAHPAIQCGRDTLEEIINNLWTAKWLPSLFYSESLCSDVPEAVLGLTPPQWSLVWFFIFALVFVRIMRRG